MAEGKAVFTAATLEDKRNLPGKDHLGPRDGQQEAQAPITVIIGGRALLILIAARFSGSGSGKDLLSRAISLIASGLLPFSSFPIPVAPDSKPRPPAPTAGQAARGGRPARPGPRLVHRRLRHRRPAGRPHPPRRPRILKAMPYHASPTTKF